MAWLKAFAFDWAGKWAKLYSKKLQQRYKQLEDIKRKSDLKAKISNIS